MTTEHHANVKEIKANGDFLIFAEFKGRRYFWAREANYYEAVELAEDAKRKYWQASFFISDKSIMVACNAADLRYDVANT